MECITDCDLRYINCSQFNKITVDKKLLNLLLNKHCIKDNVQRFSLILWASIDTFFKKFEHIHLVSREYNLFKKNEMKCLEIVKHINTFHHLRAKYVCDLKTWELFYDSAPHLTYDDAEFALQSMYLPELGFKISCLGWNNDFYITSKDIRQIYLLLHLTSNEKVTPSNVLMFNAYSKFLNKKLL